MLSMLLRVKGFAVETCNSGQRVQLVQQLPPQMLLLDSGMPGLDGYETCRRLRQ